MGQMTRLDRASRFIEEFEHDILPTLALRPGVNLRVESVRLGFRECSDEEVVAYAKLVGSGGRPEVEVELDDGVFFDPEYIGLDDVAEDLARRLNLDEGEVRHRLTSADLE